MTDLPRLDGVRVPRSPALLLRPAARMFVCSRWDLRVHAADKVPANGPVILAANHVGWLDGPLMVVTSPRRVRTLTKLEEFEGKTGVLLRAAGQIPLDRFHPDPRAVKTALKVLDSGGAVGIFPEGTRGAGDFARLHGGTAYLALVSGAPVVPVAFLGTRLPGGAISSVPPKGSRFDVVYGDPVYWGKHPWPRTRTLVRGTTDELARALRAHVAQAQMLTGRQLPGPVPAEEEP
ncbi:MAG: lysophospholipid acyltransferase family protein [Nocardioidaceae bacterium]